MALEVVDTDMRFHEEIYCSTFEFPWLFQAWDINRSQNKSRCEE